MRKRFSYTDSSRIEVAERKDPPRRSVGRRNALRLGWILACFLLPLGRPLWAEGTESVNFVPRDLSRGVLAPDGDGVAGDFDAFAVSRNPAGLVTLGGMNVGFTTTLLDREKSLIGGGGWALSLGFPLHFSIPGEEEVSLAYGFGFQSLDTPATWQGAVTGVENPQDGSYILNSFAIGSDRASIGWTVGTFFWTSSPQEQEITTHHVGLQLRPSRFLAAGLTIRDVFEPVGRVPEERFTRSYEAEVMLRPWGRRSLEVGGGALIGLDDLIDYRGRLVVRPLPGLAFLLRFDSVERPLSALGGAVGRDSRIFAGLTIESLFNRNDDTLGASYTLLTSERSGSNLGGSSVTVRFAHERTPPLIPLRRIERISLGDITSDRDFVQLLFHLHQIERSREVAGVLLILDTSPGWGESEELREAVRRLERSGKSTIAYLHDGGMRALYVGTACQAVYLHPGATFSLPGLAASGIYLKDFLERFGVGVQAVKIAEYKSAPEIFTRNSASQAAREQLSAYLSDVAQRFFTHLSAARGIPEETLARLRERVSISPPEAAEAGLIDGVFHPDEVEREVAERFGHPVSDPPETPERSRQWQEPAIAVIHVSGDIVPVSTSLFAESADGEKIAEAIEQAREDPGIRAIVLRVDSPGGAVLPSERIAREVERTRGEKPIVVSMGNVAASGGYMVSAPGERIFANPSTLTGSIGIFGLKFNLADLLARLDIHTETLRTGEHADVGSLFRPWTSEEISGIMREMRYHYERFVALVARGRGRSPEEIDRVGRGRIWSGAMAREVGLVDEIGGFLAALDAARSRAGLSPGTSVRLVQLPVRQRGMFDLVQRFTGSRLATPSLPPRIAQPLRTIPASLWSEGSVLARLPWILLTR